MNPAEAERGSVPSAPEAEAFSVCLEGNRCSLDLSRPCIMGILNVTPDSFFDGGRFSRIEDAVAQGRRLAAEGADIIDVGGESTRPGASAVSAAEEMERVVPVVERLRREVAVPLSVDTWKSAVAGAAISAGAAFVNDISGLQFDPEMARVVAKGGAGLFIMHTRGAPPEMQNDTLYRDLVAEVIAFLSAQADKAVASGIPRRRLAIDPGIGFAKDLSGNLELLGRLGELQALRLPVLLGTSRKSFIGSLLGRSNPKDRLYGTLATIALGVAAGAKIFRVHDVGPAKDAALTAWAVCSRRAGGGAAPSRRA
ncbi:MAG: dihydropteroate synthase [Desulfuromonadaceae bacterium]|nr:dihydropteroate synthase [Desulfuromonadaceae bacterium]